VGRAMKKSLVAFTSVLFTSFIVIFIYSNSKAIETVQTETSPQFFIPQEIIVKFKEIPVGDLFQSRPLIQSIINSVSGKIGTYLNREVGASDWDPSVFANRSFIGDPYLFLIKLPKGINIDYAIWFLQSLPYIEYVERNIIARLDSTEPNDEHFYR
jgi:hypothetical protein